LVLSLEIGKEELEETGNLSRKEDKAEHKIQESRGLTRNVETERALSEEEEGFKEDDWKREVRRLRKRVRELESRR
jgi:hypothetical protein